MAVIDRLRRHAAWVWLTLALILVGVLTAFRAAHGGEDTPLTVRNAKPDGALALYLWLGRLGYQEIRWQGGQLQLDRPGLRPATLMLLTPGADVTRSQVPLFLRWVERGGRIVVAGDAAGSALLSALQLRPVSALPALVSVTQPLLLAPPTTQMLAATDTVLVGPRPMAVAASSPEGSDLVRIAVGQGEVWVLTASSLLENDTIAEAENRRVALNLAGHRGATVIFDEARPGEPSSAAGTDWLTGSAWGIALLFALGGALLYRAASGWRLGPAVVQMESRHRPAAEYVTSMAGLLRRGHKRREALEIYQRALRRSLVRCYGSDRLEHVDREAQRELRRLVGEPATLTEAELVARAAEIVEWEDRVRGGRVGSG